METTARLKVSVWRDFSPTQSYAFAENESKRHILRPYDSRLQKEVYSWQTGEEIFGCISDDALRMSLRTKLIDAFNEAVDTRERTCEQLSAFLDIAEAAIDDGNSEWIASADPEHNFEDGTLELDPLRALVMHLRWIHDVYRNRPGTSILVR